MDGRLVLGGAPLGQPGDVGPRLREVMASADVLAVEDTRRLHRLASDLGVTFTGRVVTFHESVEQARLPGLLAALADGATVLLLTDAGHAVGVRPRLHAGAGGDRRRACTSPRCPGPSAVTTALAVSGLPVDRFCFEGFLPRKAGERRSRLASLADERRTMVFFESPHRLADALADAAAAFGEDREAAVCRELTKTYEEIRRGPLAELAAWAAEGVKGEITLVVAGAPERAVELDAAAARRRGGGRGGRGRHPQGRDPRRRRPHRAAPPHRLRRRRRRQSAPDPAPPGMRSVRPVRHPERVSLPCVTASAGAELRADASGRPRVRGRGRLSAVAQDTGHACIADRPTPRLPEPVACQIVPGGPRRELVVATAVQLHRELRSGHARSSAHDAVAAGAPGCCPTRVGSGRSAGTRVSTPCTSSSTLATVRRRDRAVLRSAVVLPRPVAPPALHEERGGREAASRSGPRATRPPCPSSAATAASR